MNLLIKSSHILPSLLFRGLHSKKGRMDFFTIASGILLITLALTCCLTCLMTALQCGCFGFIGSAIKKVGWGCWFFVQMLAVMGVFTFFIICIEDALIKM